VIKRQYKPELTVEVNDKGVIDVDTVKGCYFGIKNNPKGCYGLCYAKKIADYRGFDFGTAVSRYPTKDTLRLDSNYPLLKDGIIKAKKVWDLNSEVLMSKFNDATFVGRCADCRDKCGLAFMR
jgi:hypothetical protein